MEQNELLHYGIKGQKWGVRRFQNLDGTLTTAGKKRYGQLVYLGDKEELKNNPGRRRYLKSKETNTTYVFPKYSKQESQEMFKNFSKLPTNKQIELASKALDGPKLAYLINKHNMSEFSNAYQKKYSNLSRTQANDLSKGVANWPYKYLSDKTGLASVLGGIPASAITFSSISKKMNAEGGNLEEYIKRVGIRSQGKNKRGEWEDE